MTDDQPPAARPASRRRKGPSTWWFVVVPMLLAAALVGGISIAVRSSSDDGNKGPDLSGPAATLPAVTDAATELLGSTPAADAVAGQLGKAYGDVTVGLATIPDEVQFAERFTRLPDAEAKLLGRTLGAIQAQLTPKAAGGPRQPNDRNADILFALGLSRAMVQAADPNASARDQALAVLPFSVQDLEGFDALAATFASGDLATLAPKIDGALSDAGAAEVVSSIAYLIGQRIPTDGDLATTFNDAYNAELP
jgi:hypothetical protein